MGSGGRRGGRAPGSRCKTQFVGADAAGRTTTTVVPSPDLPVSPLLPLLPSMPWLPVAPVLPSLPCMPVAPCGPAGPGTATAGPGTATAGPGTSTTGPGTATAGPGTATSVGGAFTTVGLSQATKLNGTSSAAIHIEWFIGNPFVSTRSAWNGFESVQKPGSMLGILALVATVSRAAAQPRRTSSASGVGHAADILPSGALPNPCTSHSAERIGSVYLSGKPRRRFGDRAGRGLGERSEQPSVGRVVSRVMV
jgi:hypothetical protein